MQLRTLGLLSVVAIIAYFVGWGHGTQHIPNRPRVGDPRVIDGRTW